MSVGRYMAFSPSPSTAPHSPHITGLRTATAIVEQEKYLSELLAECNKLGPFMPVLPHCYRLLNQGEAGGGGGFKAGWAGLCGLAGGGAEVGSRRLGERLRLGMIQSPSSGHGWLGSPGGSSGIIIKKTIRVDIPVDKYPNYNFVGRLLGPRGNSLKRVEASTECRVLIRGRGSIKDPNREGHYQPGREEMMRGKPGYEHLNEPLHILVDAELPMEIIDSRLIQARDILEELLKPVDESQDLIKKQQLRELAMLNGTLRDDSSQMSGSLSPFHNSLGMKRAKTRG